MEFKVIDTHFGTHSNSIKIEGKLNNVKTVYDIRVHLRSMKLCIDGFGIKTGRQREFRYPKLDNYDYRKANMEEREVLTKEFYKENVPSEVLNMAMNEFLRSITVDEY